MTRDARKTAEVKRSEGNPMMVARRYGMQSLGLGGAKTKQGVSEFARSRKAQDGGR